MREQTKFETKERPYTLMQKGRLYYFYDMEEKAVKFIDLSTHPTKVTNNQGTGEWKTRRHFLFAAIATAVGLGNIWRFPSLLKLHGGGAFLLAYCFVTLINGIPLLYLEFSIGELIKKNLLYVWGEVNPLAVGIGCSCSLVSIFVAAYYAVILCWLMHYFLYSFQSPLPWIFCPINHPELGLLDAVGNKTLTADKLECSKSSAEAFYWYRKSLNISSRIDSEFEWNIYFIIVLFFIWIGVFLSLRNGIHNASKVIFTAVIFPYIALMILFVRTISINGSFTGLEYLFQPEWSRLGHLKLWNAAASQALFSLSLGFGCMTIYGSMKPANEKRNNLRDAIYITCVDTMTSIFGALVVYSILGIRAEERVNECLSEQMVAQGMAPNGSATSAPPRVCSRESFIAEAEGGTGLVFIDFTYTIAFLPGAPLFSAVFFLALFSIGFTSLVSFIVSANEIICDVFKDSRWKKMISLAVGCICIFILGIMFTQPSGEYFIQLLGSYGVDIPLLFIVLFEILAVASSKQIRQKLRDEFQHRWMAYVMETLCYLINPILIGWMMISIVVDQTKSGGIYQAWNHDRAKLKEETFPAWANVVALIFASIPILPIIIGFFYGLRVMIRRRKENNHKTSSRNGCIGFELNDIEEIKSDDK